MGEEQEWDDERVTTVGLLFESSAGLRRILEPLLLADSGLSNQSFDVLIRLARTPGFRLRMSELASQTTLTPSGLTRSVDRLEQAGIVAREACPEDRRGAFAVLSPQGRALMGQVMPLHLAHIHELLDGVLTPDEEEKLSSLLRKIRDHIRSLGHSTSCDESDMTAPVASAIV